MKEQTVEFKASLNKVIYNNEDYWILAMNVDSFTYPNIKKNKYGNVTLCGTNLFELDGDVEYDIKAVEEEGKYGPQYRYISCSREVPITENDVRKFLQTILTYNQATEIMREYPNIIDLVRENRTDEIDISKLKGIGEKTLSRVKGKIEKNFIYIDICSEFYDLISFSNIKKLHEKYKSLDKIRKEMKNDPYKTFFALDRVGFKKADEIILKMEETIETKKRNNESIRFDFGRSFRDSKERCRGAVNYYLSKNEEEEGNTKMSVEKLASLVRAYCPEARNHFKEVILDTESYVINNVDRTISFVSTLELEEYIANKLIEANKNPIKWDFEYEKYKNNGGFEMTDEQMSLFNEVCNNSFVVLTGNGGCVDCDTEFFNGTQWKRISDWTKEDKVLQYNEDGTTSLVTPEQYHKYECEELWEVKDKGVDMCLSDEHNVVYMDKKQIKTINFKEMREHHESVPRGFMGNLINNFKVKNEGIDISDEKIRLISLLIIKGIYVSEPDNSNVKLVINRSNQMIKVRDILNENQIKWRENRVLDANGMGYTEVYFESDEFYKEYPLEWYNMSVDQLFIVSEMILDFEGMYYENARYIISDDKNKADFIQYVFLVRGFSARISKKTIEDNDRYEIRIGVGSHTTLQMIENLKEKAEITKYTPIDGFKYCFTVPSHMWVMRRNGIVVVTGNSGKTQTVKGIVDMLVDNNVTFAMAAPTARASKVIEKYTGINATTIHRLLGWGRDNKPFHNESCPLPYEMIIIDEVSMLDDFLCKCLLKAINFKTTKLLFIGDPAQLSSVGMGNVLHDIINSNKFPVVKLTKIFRYNEGGLIKVTTDIRNCKKYLDENMGGKMQNFGNGYIFCPKSKENCLDYAVEVYKKFVGNYGFDNVLLLTAQNVGNFGTYKINSIIQKAVNHNKESIVVTQDGGEVKYKLGDMVIMKKNTYDSIICDETGYYDKDDDGKPEFVKLVANGETGIITSILKSGVVIKYDDTYIWTPKSILSERIRLGYCISIHSSQGSQCDNVIVITPEAHSYMTNSNLLYVATSRCKKRCVHIGNMRTINSAVKKKQEVSRETNMKDLFIKLSEVK